eukprot:g36425.t1
MEKLGPLKNKGENLCLEAEDVATGDVPEDWQVANVILLFKKGNRNDPGNYRLVFVAAVLQDPELGLMPAASPAHQTYGTMENRADETKSEDSGQIQSSEAGLERQQ